MAASPRKVSPSSRSVSPRAKPSTRIAREAYPAAAARMRSLSVSVSSRSPFSVRRRVHFLSRTSAPPFAYRRTPSCVRASTLIILRSEEKGVPPTRSACVVSPMRSAYSTSATSVGSPTYAPARPFTVWQMRIQRTSSASVMVVPSAPFFAPPSDMVWGNAVQIVSTVILFLVRVPVLSEQMTVHPPRLSTAPSRRMTAREDAMRCTPSARMTVTTAPMPSGMAATATATALMRLSKKLTLPAKREARKRAAAMEMTVNVMTFPSRAMVLSRGAGAGLLLCRRRAILPISVSMPQAVTRQRALPLTQKVPRCAVLARAESAARLTTQSYFLTALLSPVSMDSSQRKFSADKTRQSAGTRSPSSSSMTSPGTSVSASTLTTRPPRTAFASQAESFFNFSMAASARYCCKKPTTALSRMTKRRMPVSASSVLSPVTKASTAESTAARMRMTVMRSANCEKKSSSLLRFLPSSMAFRPPWARRRSASAAESPSSPHFNVAMTSCMLMPYCSIMVCYAPPARKMPLFPSCLIPRKSVRPLRHPAGECPTYVIPRESAPLTSSRGRAPHLRHPERQARAERRARLPVRDPLACYNPFLAMGFLVAGTRPAHSE